MSRVRVGVAFVVAAALAAALSVVVVRWPRLPAAERGRRLAAREGCFGCHGAEGREGAANPGRSDKSVPEFGDDLMMYAKTRDDVVAWIKDGVTPARARSATWRAQKEQGALRMPAFGRRLSAGQIDDLTEFVLAAAAFEPPEDSLAASGLERAEALGCTGCHGPGGRYARPNPRSLKGYVPSWDGADFPELVRDRGEFDQWVKNGISDRFDALPPAKFFLRRAALHMPAYERHLEPGDLDALWSYVGWLRARPSR